MRFGKIAIQNTIVQNELIDWLIDKPIDLNITHQLKYNYMHMYKIWRLYRSVFGSRPAVRSKSGPINDLFPP